MVPSRGSLAGSPWNQRPGYRNVHNVAPAEHIKSSRLEAMPSALHVDVTGDLRRSPSTWCSALLRPVGATSAACATALAIRGNRGRNKSSEITSAALPAMRGVARGSVVMGKEPGAPQTQTAELTLTQRLWQEFREQARPGLLVPATLISMSLSGASAVRAFLSGSLLDLAVQSPVAPKSAFLKVGGVYFAAALYVYVANVVQGILFALARWNMSMAMRQKLFAKLLTQEVAFFEANSSGALVSRLTNDTDQMQQTLNRAPEALLTNLLRCIIALTLMAKQHVLLTVISILPIPFAWMIIRRTGKIVGKFGVMQNDALARVNAVAHEAVSSARAVQLAGAQTVERKAYAKAIESYLGVIRRTLFTETALRFLSRLLNDAYTDVPLMCLSCWLIANGEISVGQFYTYRSLLFSYRLGFRELAELFTGLAKTQAVSQRYFELTDRIPKITNRPDAHPLSPEAVRGTLKLQDVSFRYDTTVDWALQNVTFQAHPGEVLALVGASGAGKSTVLRLCARLADPEVGAVSLDDIDLRDIKLDSLRQCLGSVDQAPAIFDRSVYDNIVYGCHEEDSCDKQHMEVVKHAAEAARADDFVTALPRKYDERLGEQGSRLSGGQKQRLAIARALVRGSPVLLLDEPTSALDGETEEAIANTLRDLASDGKTVIVAAHRLGTVMCADRLVVLDKGRVVEEGSREDLLQRPDSRYRAVVEPQLGK